MNETELLTVDELVEITGRKTNAAQRAWLDRAGWCYVVNAAGRPIVGRWYARMTLAGVRADGAVTANEPDFSAIR